MSGILSSFEWLVYNGKSPVVSPSTSLRTLSEDSSDETKLSYSGYVGELDSTSIIFVCGIFLALIIVALVKVCISDSRTVRRREAKELAKRKKYIRETVMCKKVLKKKRKHEDHDDDNSLLEAGQFLNDNSSTPALQRQKTDLVLSSRHLTKEEDDEDETRLECQICMDDFEVGDHICWSHNPQCIHTFHMDCLEPWLMKHDECPLCRLDYLVPEQERPKEQEPPVAANNSGGSFFRNWLRRRSSVEVAPGHQNTQTGTIQPIAASLTTTSESTDEQSTDQEGQGEAACADEGPSVVSIDDIEAGNP